MIDYRKKADTPFHWLESYPEAERIYLWYNNMKREQEMCSHDVRHEQLIVVGCNYGWRFPSAKIMLI